jgi:hypothetical protein
MTMAVHSAAVFAATHAKAILSNLIVRRDDAQAANSSAIAPGPASSGISATNAANGLTGASQTPLSDGTLAFLLGLQHLVAGPSQSPDTTGTNPPGLFSAMDGDGNGQVSQSEMENYFKAGADILFSKVSPDGQTPITQDQLATHVAHGLKEFKDIAGRASG